MITSLGLLSISLLLLALTVRASLATPLTVAGLMGLVLLRLSVASGGWSLRRSIVRAGAERNRATGRRRSREDGRRPPEGWDDA